MWRKVVSLWKEKVFCMEPIITIEGYKLQQNREEMRRLLSEYYRKLGYHVVGMPDMSPAPAVSEKHITEVKR